LTDEFPCQTSRDISENSIQPAPVAFLPDIFGIGSEAVKAALLGALVSALTLSADAAWKIEEGEGSFSTSETFDLVGVSVRSNPEFYTLRQSRGSTCWRSVEVCASARDDIVG
jgi:hypothetical protein